MITRLPNAQPTKSACEMKSSRPNSLQSKPVNGGVYCFTDALREPHMLHNICRHRGKHWLRQGQPPNLVKQPALPRRKYSFMNLVHYKLEICSGNPWIKDRKPKVPSNIRRESHRYDLLNLISQPWSKVSWYHNSRLALINSQSRCSTKHCNNSLCHLKLRLSSPSKQKKIIRKHKMRKRHPGPSHLHRGPPPSCIADEIKELKCSMQRTKRYGDKESPWRKPHLGLKLGSLSPFQSTERDTKVTQYIMS